MLPNRSSPSLYKALYTLVNSPIETKQTNKTNISISQTCVLICIFVLSLTSFLVLLLWGSKSWVL